MSEVFLTHGPWGAAVVALTIAVKVLYTRIQDLSDKRVEDNKFLIEQYRTALEENTKTIDVLSRSFETRRKS